MKGFVLRDAKNGHIWIGTTGGLTRLKNDRFDIIAEDDGLFDHRINHLLEDDNGFFWISCNRGIYRVGREDLNKRVQGEIDTVHSVDYEQSDGMAAPETLGGHQPAGWKARDGTLYFPSPKGFMALTGVLIGLSGWGVHRYRLKQGLKVEQLQNELELQNERTRIRPSVPIRSTGREPSTTAETP